MKARYILFAVAAVIISACSVNNEPVDVVNRQITIEAIQEGYDGLTKTAVKDGGKEVYWEPNDEIKVFYSGTGSRFVSNNSELTGVTKFTGTLSAVIGFNEGFSDDNPLWGLYPYRADATSDGSSVVTTLPEEQTGRAGTFAKNTHITIGRSTSLAMGFYAVNGGVRFSLTQEGINQIIFHGANDEALAGKIMISFQSGLPTIQEVIDIKTSIRLLAPNGGAFETGKWYYISALPVALPNGFTIKLIKGTTSATYVNTSSVSIKRAIFGSIPEMDSSLVFSEETVDPSISNISFSDNLAKLVCVTNFDTNDDGELSYTEAAAVNSIGTVFRDLTELVSFDEFQYFTGVKSIPDYAFSGCKKLASIVLPPDVTSLGLLAFANCQQLSELTIPSGVIAIGNYAFSYCTNLKSISMPNGLKKISEGAFNNCLLLESIVIPDQVKTIELSAFYYCRSLKSIDIPENVTSIGAITFGYCYGLGSITIPSKITSIGAEAFIGCSKLTSISILPLDPPIGGERMFENTGNCPIYVPDVSVNKYRTAENWSSYITRIQAL